MAALESFAAWLSLDSADIHFTWDSGFWGLGLEGLGLEGLGLEGF